MGNFCHKETVAQAPGGDIPISSTDASMKPSLAVDSQAAKPSKPASTATSAFKSSPIKEVEPVAAKESEPKPAPAAAQEKPVKLDPKDFMFVKKENETLVRAPGQIKGQQFIIDGCKNCDIYLLDNSATISVDDCTNCRIFIGPCESSVFIRDCKDLKVIVACQQLRLRDCHGVDMLIYISAGQPSIETSDKIRIGCFDFSYFSLRSQFEASGLPVWNSEWSNVHDFNLTSGETHWEFLPEDVKWSDLVKPPHEHCPAISAEETALDSAVPVTWGKRPKFAQESCFVACFAPNLDAGFDLLSSLKQQLSSRDLYVMRTRQSKLRPAEASSLFSKDKKLIDLAAKAGGTMVGLEFQGEDSNKIVGAAAKALSSGCFFVTPDANVGLQMSHIYFEQLRPSI